MIEELITEGPTVEDALDAALEQMGVQQDSIEFEVVDEPTRGMFGGGKHAKVRVWLKKGALKATDLDDDDEVDEGQPLSTTATAVTEPRAELTDEELDAIADTGVAVIREITAALGLEAGVEEYEGDEGELILDIIGDDLGLLIGRHGRTLDALQVLVSAITNRRLDQRYPLVVDVSGYRHRRRIKLEEIAKRAAERASRQHRPVELRPMTSFERRVIHMVLRDDRRVTTESTGEEPRRMVVVHPR